VHIKHVRAYDDDYTTGKSSKSCHNLRSQRNNFTILVAKALTAFTTFPNHRTPQPPAHPPHTNWPKPEYLSTPVPD